MTQERAMTDQQVNESSAEPEHAHLDESSEFYQSVAKVIGIMRPAIQADEGDIFLRAVDSDGLVSVELTGACVTCPASTATMKDGIERILKKRVEGVTGVTHVGEELMGAEEGTLVSLAGSTKVSPFAPPESD